MRIILVGEVYELDALAKAAMEAIRYEQRDGRPSGNLLGLRIDGRYFSVKWGKSSLTVRHLLQVEPAI